MPTTIAVRTNETTSINEMMVMQPPHRSCVPEARVITAGLGLLRTVRPSS